MLTLRNCCPVNYSFCIFLLGDWLSRKLKCALGKCQGETSVRTSAFLRLESSTIRQAGPNCGRPLMFIAAQRTRPNIITLFTINQPGCYLVSPSAAARPGEESTQIGVEFLRDLFRCGIFAQLTSNNPWWVQAIRIMFQASTVGRLGNLPIDVFL